MSNIDNHFNDNKDNAPIDYTKREDYTNKVRKFIEEFDEVIPFVIQEYDDIDRRFETKKCKAFKEKRDGLAALKKFHDEDMYQNLLYWYVTQPKEN